MFLDYFTVGQSLCFYGTPFLSITVAVVVGWATVQSKRQDLLAKWQNK